MLFVCSVVSDVSSAYKKTPSFLQMSGVLFFFYPFSHCFKPFSLRKNHKWKGMDTKKVRPSAMGWVSWMPVKSNSNGKIKIRGIYRVP